MSTRLQKIILYFFLFYSLFGFFIVPIVIKSQLVKFVDEKTSLSKIEIANIYFNPYIFTLDIEGLRTLSSEKKPLLSFTSFKINIDPSSLLLGAVKIKELSLKEPKISVVYSKDKKINLLSVFNDSPKESSKTQESTNSLRFIVKRLKVEEGLLVYKDFTHKDLFESSFHDIGFILKDIDTADLNSSDGVVRFYSKVEDGGFIDFKSNIRGFAPLKVDGSLDIQASKLYTKYKYIKDMLNIEVADGKLSFHANYAFNADDINATTINDIDITLEKLRVIPKGGSKDILRLERFAVADAWVQPLTQDIKVPLVKLKGLQVQAQRDRNGSIDWQGYVEVNTASSKENNSSEKEWKLLVNEVKLSKIGLVFNDKYIEPSVTSRVKDLSLNLHNVTLKGEKPFFYELSMSINEKAKLLSKGSIAHKNLEINALTSLSDFNVIDFKPYIDTEAKKALSLYNLDLKSLSAGFNVASRLYKEDSKVYLDVEDANLTLKDFSMLKANSQEKLSSFKAFRISKISLDTKEEKLRIGDVLVDALDAHIQKYKDATLNVNDLVIPKKEKVEKKSPSKYLTQVKHFALKGAKLAFVDNSLEQKTEQIVDNININLFNIDSRKNHWLSYDTSMRINRSGTVKTKGKLQHTPLEQKGKFIIKDIALQNFNPYVQESAFVKIRDGMLSLKGKTEYKPSKKKPDLRVESSFDLNSLFVNSSLDNTLLLSLSEVKTDAFTLELSPNRLYVNELDVDSFYVKAKIDKKKVLNFSQLTKKSDTKKEKKKSATFPMYISRVNVSLGSAEFADYSIPIKFHTNIHNLNGVIYSLSNTAHGTMYVNISGDVDKYGSTRLKGSVDSANPKEYTDLAFNFKNLNLNSLSGYSASFAGHEIDSGKLYLDLNYDILNSKLRGGNNVILKKVVLGKEVEDENITVLPLGFVFGLLEDNEGVIDMDMAVEGNVDAPDFKYGPLVLKTLGGIISKAVTSPFKFLGSVMGFDAQKLEFIDFERGGVSISPPEREKLDIIAKILMKKPKISLKIFSSYDQVNDKKALQLEKLIDIVMHRSGLKNREEHESAMSIDLLEDIYTEQGDDAVLEALQDKLHKELSDNEFKRAYQSALIDLCINIQHVTKEELEALAMSRVKSIMNYLVNEKFISADRITYLLGLEQEKSGSKYVKVKMEIEVK